MIMSRVTSFLFPFLYISLCPVFFHPLSCHISSFYLRTFVLPFSTFTIESPSLKYVNQLYTSKRPFCLCIISLRLTRLITAVVVVAVFSLVCNWHQIIFSFSKTSFMRTVFFEFLLL